MGRLTGGPNLNTTKERHVENTGIKITANDVGRTVQMRDGRICKITGFNPKAVLGWRVKSDHEALGHYENGRFFDDMEDEWDIVAFADTQGAVTLKQAATQAGVTYGRAYSLARRGKIKGAKKVGCHYRVTVEALRKACEKRKAARKAVAAQPEPAALVGVACTTGTNTPVTRESIALELIKAGHEAAGVYLIKGA